MSDLEDYPYSPYDDLEDILYDADPAPELADDLAEHALHSPVYLDEVAGYELEEYHSDWEYYSDDYMDDDPALERQHHHQEPAPPMKRGKKRKLIETAEIPSLDLNEAKLITRSIKGTVWAQPREAGPPIHHAVDGDKISLMKDWRRVFSIQDDGWGRRADTTENDESWAKNMSLADMGLQPQRSKSFEREQSHQDDGFDGEESATADDSGDAESDAEDYPEESDTSLDRRPVQQGLNGNGFSQVKDADNQMGDMPGGAKVVTASDQLMNAMYAESSIDDGDGITRKRRRSSSNSSPSINPKDKRARRGDAPRVNVAVEVRSEQDIAMKTTRKRKASEEPHGEHREALESLASSRVKRVPAARTNGITKQNTTDSSSAANNSRRK